MSKAYRFPLKMHIGAPAVPIVKEGQSIKRGECIAEPKGLGAKIHSSIFGTVRAITGMYIEILAENIQTKDYIKIKECRDICEAVYEAGVIGSGGAGFPTYVKLQTKLEGGYIIANCVECEPALHHNIKLLEEASELVVRGIEYAMKATGAKKAYIAIKEKNQKAIKSIESCLKDSTDIEIHTLKDIYPMGEERAIIHDIFGQWLEPNQLPIEVNSVILNAETLCNITKAVEERKPVIDKDITVIGNLRDGNTPHVCMSIPVGMPIKELIENCGGINGDYGEIVLGGPYTGVAVDLEEEVVTKTSGGVIVTIPLPEYRGNLGLLVCACGADENRLRDIGNKMHANIVGVAECKNIIRNKGVAKCKTPGDCPGQIAAVLKLKSMGAERILISNCSDCSNTVMSCAPKLNIPVYHHTDHIFRTIDYKLTRRLSLEESEGGI